MKELVIESSAKINLGLKIIKKRTDGYHEIQTILQQIGLFDQLKIKMVSSGIHVVCQNENVPEDKRNLVYKAAQLLIQTAGIKNGVHVCIDKKIPVGAGLGGGSSNAAATLIGMNQLWGLGFDKNKLISIGKKIGADVPFFIFGNTAWATGIGDKLYKLPAAPTMWLALIFPNIHISTHWVYENLNLGLTRENNNIKMLEFALVNHNIFEIGRYLYNDLESVVIRKHPEIQEIKDVLCSMGAIGSLMSGSGSSVFGLFLNKEEAANVCRELIKNKNWTVFLTKTKN